ncbi:MAG: glycosyl hydrolase-related protein [candidate division KSB1 bacterium]|nr:glycosyl hydrolase-related protein [candidate division KSB1 bacterium]MDZ7276325.1 glycosyl hydrolase-related protein [candidate division KSB1 bacterium]MDZ7287722.1 glycosyl hydrolase-related protein [candidate division KSB1 bacterium]MDZ7299938.1 glycosyl hydrolase-related protein [candidate division KSB1 bacterium]MDZ7305733.1 glycosyl hydrolase-related protein [candidate division KSB1 bacterium]
MEPTYHFISHSHWDREWYKTFETFRLDLVDMINALLDIFAQVPDYEHFTLDGQTIVLEDYAAILPQRAEELRRLVQAGKLAIGPWYVLPDEFLVAGESTVRNLLMGAKVGAAYGAVMPLGYLPDSFGHLAMMPAILRGFDMDTAIIYRGFGGEPGQEKSEYRWRAPDGSTVLMIHLPPNGYGDAYIGTDSEDAFRRKARELKEILDPRASTPHRLCMNGGDHHFPEPYLPRALRVMNALGEGRFIHSSLPACVAAIKRHVDEAQIVLPQIEGELRGGFRYAFAVQSGVYSSRMYLKQANYAAEKLLTRYAEPLAVWADLAGRRHLLPMLAHGWRLLLQNHPHDSICGCSIDAVHREMMTRFAKVQQVGEAIIDKAVRHLHPDAWQGGEHVLVFNPQTRCTSQVVPAVVEFFRQKIVVGLNPTVRVEKPLPLIAGFCLRDETGREVPCQILQHEPAGHGLRYSDYSYPSKRLTERFHILLDAKRVPALGFARYRVALQERMPVYHSSLCARENVLENDFLRVEVLANGAITLLDKRTGDQFPGLHVFEDGGDAGDEYNYSPPRQDAIFTSHQCAATRHLLETGPLRATIAITLALSLPAGLTGSRQSRSRRRVPLPICTRVRLYHNQPWVECETTVENNVKDHRLRVLFASGLQTNVSHSDSQFGLTRREHHVIDPAAYNIEVPPAVHPMQRGVTMVAGGRGLTIATAGLPEYELKVEEPGTLAITLLRCVARLSGGDLLMRPGGEAGWITDTPEAQCPGTHSFRYAIIPHTAAQFEDYGSVNEQLENFHLPFLAVRRGGDPAVHLAPFGIELVPSALVLSACKPAEDGRGVIVRMYNPTAAGVQGRLTVTAGLQAAWLTQLNERDLQELPITAGTRVDFEVAARQILSLRLRLDCQGLAAA